MTMKASEFVKIAKAIATKYKTLYVMGGYGAPATEANKTRYINGYKYNQNPDREAMIRNASANTFFFDCVCLIKGILWGWNGNTTARNGGAVYKSNGVPDIDADQMINRCKGVSTNFNLIMPGEVVWKSGHIGIYIGDGLVVESTPAWANKVQITALGNVGAVTGYYSRIWVKHGFLPWVDYNNAETGENKPNTTDLSKYTDEQLADMVMRGDFGNGEARKKALGSRYNAVQAIVDSRYKANANTSGIKVGDWVTVTNPINYDNGKRFVLYYKRYKVMELIGNRAVIGINGVVTSAINVKYLRKV